MKNIFKENAVLVTLFLFLFTCKIQAQEFVNGDLEDTINGLSSLPTGWLSIPYTDINCLANDTAAASPDLTSMTLPDAAFGINGNPYSGGTFVSGLHGSGFNGQIWHEGIHQVVNGFVVGNTYPINFHQAVVKQANCMDSSGSWIVYVDNSLIGITNPTSSKESFNSINFIWEFRSFSFTATSTSHDIKFLPFDDDPLISAFSNDGLRMGIDCIHITAPCNAVGNSLLKKIQDTVLFYPNPVIDKMYFNNNTKIFSEIILYDLAARIILQENVTESTYVDLANFDSGIYIYELRNKNEVYAKGKVIKE
jgi:hypothetical protein